MNITQKPTCIKTHNDKFKKMKQFKYIFMSNMKIKILIERGYQKAF